MTSKKVFIALGNFFSYEFCVKYHSYVRQFSDFSGIQWFIVVISKCTETASRTTQGFIWKPHGARMSLSILGRSGLSQTYYVNCSGGQHSQ